MTDEWGVPDRRRPGQRPLPGPAGRSDRVRTLGDARRPRPVPGGHQGWRPSDRAGFTAGDLRSPNVGLLRGDGSISRLRPNYGSVCTAGWDPIRVLRGGAPEIFEGERVAEVRAALQSYADGTGTFDDVREAFDAAVFSVGMGPGRRVEEIYRFADEAGSSDRCTFDSVLWRPLLEKTITLEQRAELAEFAQFTIGDRGQPRRPDDSGELT